MIWGIIPILSVYEAASYEMMQHQGGSGNLRPPFEFKDTLKDQLIDIPEGHAFTAVGELWEMRECLEFGIDLFAGLISKGKPGGLLCTGNIGKPSLLRRAQFLKDATKHFAKGGKKVLLMSELSKAGYAHHRATKSMARIQVMHCLNYQVDRIDALFHRPGSLAIDAATFRQEIGKCKFLHMTTGMYQADYGEKRNKKSARV